jgi:hypothetical protein
MVCVSMTAKQAFPKNRTRILGKFIHCQLSPFTPMKSFTTSLPGKEIIQNSVSN